MICGTMDRKWMTESWTLSPQASNCKNGKKQVRREGGKPDGMTERYNQKSKLEGKEEPAMLR